MFVKFITFVLYLVVSSFVYAENIKTYKIIVPFSAGGASDVLLRFIEPELNQQLAKHQINLIVVNKVGAGGSIGLDTVIKSDELTFGFFSPFFAINKNIKNDYYYDFNSVEFLSFAGYNKMVILSGTYTNINQLKELCLNNKSISFGSSGIGSTSHLASYLFAKKYLKCKDILSVPYKGVSSVYPDLKAGRINFMADFAINVDGFIETKYLNYIEEIKESDFASWHILVSNKNQNKDSEIVKIEFESLKRNVQFTNRLQERFKIYKFTETKDTDWLKNQFVTYKKLIDSMPASN